MSLTNAAKNNIFNLFQLCMSIRQFEKIIVEAFSSPIAKIIHQAFQEFAKVCDTHMPKRTFLEFQYGVDKSKQHVSSLVCYDMNRNQVIYGNSVWKPSHLHRSFIWSPNQNLCNFFHNDMFINKQIAKYYTWRGTSHAQAADAYNALWWSLPHLEHYRNWYHMLDEYKAEWVRYGRRPPPNTLSFYPLKPLSCMVCIKHFMQLQ